MSREKKKKKNPYIWVFIVTICAFLISLGFSFLSDLIIPKVSILVASLILIFFIILGIVFDMIGLAVTVSEEKSFHSMASKKVRGARLAVTLIRNAEKVSSFCNDVIGDICGIMSGSTAVTIAVILSSELSWNLSFVTLILTAVVASLTIGGKALGKMVAIKNGDKILYQFARILSIFVKK